MSEDNVVAFGSPTGIEDPLTELLRTGAKRLIQQAIEAELIELLARFEGTVDDQGRRAALAQDPRVQSPGQGHRTSQGATGTREPGQNPSSPMI